MNEPALPIRLIGRAGVFLAMCGRVAYFKWLAAPMKNSIGIESMKLIREA
jgi:hypothetical protein